MTQETSSAKASAGRRTMTVLAVVSLLGVAGCSSVPDAVNPVEWYRGTSETVGGWFGGEKAGEVPPDEPKMAGSPGPSTNTQYPNLASVPERPTPSTTAAQRETLKQELVADRANARYTDAPATANAPVRTPAKPVVSAPAASAPAPEPQPVASAPAAQPEPRSTVAQAPLPQAVASAPASTADTGRLVADPANQSALWPNRPAPEIPNVTAITRGDVGGEHERVMVSEPTPEALPTRSASATMTRSAPSSQLAERTTYDSAGTASRAAPPPAEPAVRQTTPPPAAAQTPPPAPSATSQSVIVNEDAIDSAPAAVSFSGQPYLATTIYFGHGSAQISAAERSELAKIAKTAVANGAAMRVIGHASARTADLDLRSHEVANLTMSLKRANAVADVLIRAGLPADRIRVDALGDSQPEFYEVMPSGEAGNRRVEVILLY